MKRFNTAALFSTTLAVALVASAQPSAQGPSSAGTPRTAPPPSGAEVPRPSLAQALKGLAAAITSARDAGIALSCAVLDVHGDLIAFVRMDNAPFLTGSLAEGKALASALFGRPSGEFGAMAASPFFTSVNASVGNRIVPAQGAVPILRDDHVIGAVGCSGGAPPQDEAAAKAALVAF
ncbi:MAG TPA: heme-binding protein [Steroidobacteraceae bacterium]|nr:heme-binding protein [Steroidobacteraceae bacterium]